jgi:hypothetical protein
MNINKNKTQDDIKINKKVACLGDDIKEGSSIDNVSNFTVSALWEFDQKERMFLDLVFIYGYKDNVDYITYNKKNSSNADHSGDIIGTSALTSMCELTDTEVAPNDLADLPDDLPDTIPLAELNSPAQIYCRHFINMHDLPKDSVIAITISGYHKHQARKLSDYACKNPVLVIKYTDENNLTHVRPLALPFDIAEDSTNMLLCMAMKQETGWLIHFPDRVFTNDCVTDVKQMIDNVCDLYGDHPIQILKNVL